jgi:hypothetical protein
MKTYFETRQMLVAGLAAAAVVVTACGSEPEVPPAQTQTEVSRQLNAPTTVTGCLRAGDAADTFVLTTAQSVDGTPPATYHLASTPDVDLRPHVGSRVEASGIVDAQSQIATREPATPADNATTGTGGTAATPMVQTGTELAIKKFDVKSIKPVGGDCEL